MELDLALPERAEPAEPQTIPRAAAAAEFLSAEVLAELAAVVAEQAEDPEARMAAARALARLTPSYEDAIEPLRTNAIGPLLVALTDEHPGIRTLAAQALGAATKGSDAVWPLVHAHLVNAVKNDPDPNVRAAAAAALGRIGTLHADDQSPLLDALGSVDVQSTLLEALGDDSVDVRRAAAEALARLVRKPDEP